MGIFNKTSPDEKKRREVMNYSIRKIGQSLFKLMPRTVTAVTYSAVKRGNKWDQKVNMYMTKDLAHEKPIQEKEFEKRFNISADQIKAFYEDSQASIDYALRNLPDSAIFNYLLITITYDGYIQWRYGYSTPKNVNGLTGKPLIGLDKKPIAYDGENIGVIGGSTL